ncbi:alpha/beta fold hydrolase [Roseomonas elaeocarpi]|uniref:Alpha/beta hydrolase n=1 Tax=Roseomonas elaeocarpi TaxID=907779 RepID=A0ABV6JMT7_9PROT
MRFTLRSALFATLPALALALASTAWGQAAAPSAGANQQPAVNPGTPAPDCRIHVNYDRNAELVGYAALPDGKAPCIPFTATYQLVPGNYAGADFYAEEFTDAKIRERWATCRENPACADPARKGAQGFTAYEPRRTGSVQPEGRIDPDGAVDLRAVRRPGFFARAPFSEPIAAAEPRTTTVEFTVPRDSYERLHLKLTDSIHLRGWYMEGSGIDDGAGGKRRALVILNNGGGSELTATDDPAHDGISRDAQGRYVVDASDNGAGEQPGMRHWRGFLQALNAAGFDVLVTDRRGNGISGGRNGFNTAEQARDMFRELEQLETGEGLRLLTPAGELLEGRAAAGRLLAGQKAREIPVVIGGYSRGSYATAWAMQQNFVADCDRDQPDAACKPPRGWTNIRGAILYGPNSGGLGWRPAGHDMIEAALRVERNTTYYPDSEVYAGIAKWPGLLIIKGTWDYVEGLEGSLTAWRRAPEPKEIAVFRGPHVLNTQNADNMRFAGERMVAFATAAVLGRKQVEGAHAPADLRALVLSSPDHWELTTAPSN